METAPDQDTLTAQPSGSLRSLGRDAVLFASGTIAGKAIGLLMLPILTRVLSPDAFGRVDVLSVLASASISTLFLGLDLAVTRHYFSQPLGQIRRSVLSTWYVMSTVIVLPFSIALGLFASPVSIALFGSDSEAWAVAAVSVTVVVGTYQVLGLNVLRIHGHSGAYALVNAGSLLLYAVFTVVLVTHWQAAPISVMTALAAAWGVSSLLTFLAIRGYVAGAPSRAQTVALVRLALPLAPAVVAIWVGEFANRAILLAASDPATVAVLSVALRLASIATLAVVAFQLAWQPRVYARGSSSDALVRSGREARLAFLAVSVVVLLVGASAPVLIGLLGSDYSAARLPMGIALAGALLSVAILVLSTERLLAMQTRSIGLAGVVGVVTAVVLNVALAPVAGAVGSAAALAGGQLANASVLMIRRPAPRLEVGLAAVLTAAVVAAAVIAMSVTT